MSKRVLVIAAHPDDEVLGCGGTMAWHAEQGDRVDILILCEGATSRDERRDVAAHRGEIEALRAAAAAAAAELGANCPRFSALPDNRLDGMMMLDVVKELEKVVREVAPDVIYTHHGGDLNVDHRIVHQAVLTACRPIPGSAAVPDLYAFEVPSSTEWAGPWTGPAFVPNHFIDISRVSQGKIKALQHYASEMRAYPHARSIQACEALARWRGASSGFEAAEAFVVLRQRRS